VIRRLISLTLAFLGLATAFSALSLAALGRVLPAAGALLLGAGAAAWGFRQLFRSRSRSGGSAGSEGAAGSAGRGAVLLIGALTLGLPGPASAQATPAPRGDAHRTRFSSFDVGMGAAFPAEARAGISYGAAFDVANLLLPGAALRFGFGFWTSEDAEAGGRTVEIDDSILSVLLKTAVAGGATHVYLGVGAGAHFVSARFADRIGETEGRDGFRPGLEGLAGLEVPLADEGFIALFAEGRGSLVSRMSQGAVRAGVRIRFDRLGAGG
jgi:hypothetical protein